MTSTGSSLKHLQGVNVSSFADSIRTGQIAASMRNDVNRRRVAANALNWLNNIQYDQTASYIRQLWANDSDRKVLMIDPIPFVRLICSELGSTFNSNVTISGEGFSESQSTLLSSMLDKCLIYNKLKDIDVMVECVGDIHVLPTFRNGIVDIVIVTPDRAMVRQSKGDPSSADVFYYLISQTFDSPMVAREEIWAKFDENFYYEVKFVNGKEVNVIEPVLHGFSRMPVVHFTNSMRYDRYWLDDDYPHVIFNQSLNAIIAAENHMLYDQTYSQLMSTYEFEIKTITMGIDRLIQASSGMPGAEGEIKFLTPDAKIEQVLKVVNDKIDLYLAMYRLSGEMIRKPSNAASGYQLKLTQAGKTEYINSKKPLYNQRIRELVGLMIEKLNSSTNSVLPLDANITVTYGDNVDISDPMTQSSIDSMNINSNIESIVDVIMRRNPDMTREEALAKAKQNVLDNEEVRTTSNINMAGY